VPVHSALTMKTIQTMILLVLSFANLHTLCLADDNLALPDSIEKTDISKDLYKKGVLLLHLSLPYVNFFVLEPENENTKLNAGFLGAMVGFDYYHTQNQFLNVGLSGITDFEAPAPAPIMITSGIYEFMSSGSVTLSNNHRTSKFTYGYGLSFSRNTWVLQNHSVQDTTIRLRQSVTKSHNTIGFVFPVYYRLGNYFHVGLIFKPTFWRPDITPTFGYEYVISIDFAWKIKLFTF
jgi:hypothetical protein